MTACTRFRRINLEPGNAMILATDGFFECSNAVADGTTRLANFVAANAHQQPKDFIRALHEEAVAHVRGVLQADNLTVVIIKRIASTSSPNQSQTSLAKSS